MIKYIVKKKNKEYIYYTLSQVCQNIGICSKTINEYFNGEKNKVNKMGYEIERIIINDTYTPEKKAVEEENDIKKIIDNIVIWCEEYKIKNLYISYDTNKNNALIVTTNFDKEKEIINIEVGK